MSKPSNFRTKVDFTFSKSWHPLLQCLEAISLQLLLTVVIALYRESLLLDRVSRMWLNCWLHIIFSLWKSGIYPSLLDILSLLFLAMCFPCCPGSYWPGSFPSKPPVLKFKRDVTYKPFVWFNSISILLFYLLFPCKEWMDSPNYLLAALAMLVTIY